jgi:hypothetical protein
VNYELGFADVVETVVRIRDGDLIEQIDCIRFVLCQAANDDDEQIQAALEANIEGRQN